MRLDSAYQDNWSKVKYDYDALGRPVRKWRGDPVNGWMFDRLWVYDGDQRVLSLDANNNRVEEYACAPGIDQPIATIRGPTGIEAISYHVQDELGNILGLVENGAYVSQTLSYDAWGTPTETGIGYNNQLYWKSLKWEGDVISLYYMRNRWYDSETGRFMSEDPIGLAGGINLYAFAGNDPVNGSDPFGLRACPAGYSALGYITVMGSNGDYWCIPPAVLVDVEVNARGGGGWSRGDRGSGWMRGGGDGPGGDLGGPGGGGGNGSESAKRPLITRECISASAMLAITGATDFTVVGPAARAGVQLGARAFSHVVSGLSFDVICGAGYISKNQHRRLGGTAWGMASGYSSAAGIRAHTVANEAVGTVDLGLVSGDLSGWDFVPYLATLRSLDRAIRTCL